MILIYQVPLKLADEDSEDDLQLVPGRHGMNVPSACTIVIIAGFRLIQTQTISVKITFSTVGKYISGQGDDPGGQDH